MSRKKNLPRGISKLSGKSEPQLLSVVEKQFLGIVARTSESLDDANAHVILKYYRPSVECFSQWTKNELKAFSNFVENINRRTWLMIYNSGGHSGGKLGNGLGYKIHKNHDNLPKDREIIQRISEDITFFELRVSDVARVHGFRVQSAFFLVWLDREHKFYPE